MRTVTVYHCDLCDAGFLTPEEAAACEARGRGVAYPIGMMWRAKLEGSYLVRPLAELVTYAVVAEAPSARGHERHYYHWAAGCVEVDGRALDTGHFLDVLPTDGLPSRVLDKAFDPARAQPPDPTLSSFRRKVVALRTFGITPTVWNGERAIPLPSGA